MANVRPTVRADLGLTARLHRRELPRGFFARLGPGFLRSYHATFLRSPHALALTAEHDGRPVGFLVGTFANRPHYRFVIRCCVLVLVLRGLLALLARPPLAWRFLHTRALGYLRWLVRYPLRSRTDATEPAASTDSGPTGPVAVLTHVAVAPAARGLGLGRELVDAFVAAARSAGAVEARLVTDADGGGVDFYRRLGWTAGQERRDRDGTVVQEFRLSLP